MKIKKVIEFDARIMETMKFLKITRKNNENHDHRRIPIMGITKKMKILKIHIRIMKIKKIFEFHAINTKIMRIIEFHYRKIKTKKILKFD